MSYRYEASDEEYAAAAILREKGWRVSEPECPECHGFGVVPVWGRWGSDATTTTSVGTKPCPRDCYVLAFSVAA